MILDALFARNRLNFWGPLVMGLLILALAAVCVFVALPSLFDPGPLDAHLVVLLGILLTLMGLFAIMLQEYFARWVESKTARDRSLRGSGAARSKTPETKAPGPREDGR